jgi:predicted ATPase
MPKMTRRSDSAQKSEFEKKISKLFVGREKEFAILDHLLYHVRNGSGKFVLINGEAGIGKTALVNHFFENLSGSDLTVVKADFQYADKYTPYAPFLKALSQRGDSEFDKLSPLIESMLAQKKESHGKKSEDLYSLETQGGMIQQILASGILEASQKKPICIILNDVHLAPLVSWKFIHYLSLCMIKGKIMLVATLRQDGKKKSEGEIPPYADTLERMNREGLIERINLKRFKKGDIKQLCKSIFPLADFSGQLFSQLFQVTNGVPSDAVKVMRYLIQKNLLYQNNGIWFNREDISKESLLDYIREDAHPSELKVKLKKISPDTRKMLGIMALMESSLDYRILESFFDYSGIEILKKLQELVESKWIIILPDETFQLKRPSLRHLVLEVIPLKNRESIHLKIARAIENIEDYHPHRIVFDLAFHYGNTKNFEVAFKYIHKAADLSLRNFAYSEAQDFYSKAISLIKKNNLLAKKEEAMELILESIWLNRISGNWKVGLDQCSYAREILNDTHNPEFRQRILIQEGFLKFKVGDWKKSISCFKQVLKSNDIRNTFISALANFGLGCNYFELSDFTKSGIYYQSVHMIAKANGYEKLLANALNDLGVLKNIQGDYIHAIATYSASIPIFKKMEDNKGLARVYHNIGMTHAEMNNWTEADKFYSESLSLTDSLGLLPLKLITFINRSRAKIHMNQLDAAEEYLHKALRIVEMLDDKLSQAEYHKIKGLLERYKKHYNSAERHYKAAIDIFTRHQNKLGLAETEFEMSRLAEVMGGNAKRKEWLQKSINHYQDIGIDCKVSELRQELSEIDNRVLQPSHEVIA